MKRYLALLALAVGMHAHGQQVTRAETLTSEQQKRIADADAKVVEAQANAQAVRDAIAGEHNMKGERWMEWQSWYEISGNFILFRFQR